MDYRLPLAESGIIRMFFLRWKAIPQIQPYCKSVPDSPVMRRKPGLSGSWIYLDPLVTLLIASFYPKEKRSLRCLLSLLSSIPQDTIFSFWSITKTLE